MLLVCLYAKYEILLKKDNRMKTVSDLIWCVYKLDIRLCLTSDCLKQMNDKTFTYIRNRIENDAVIHISISINSSIKETK